MLKILAIAAGAYLFLVGFIYLTQASLLYLPGVPSRQLVATPDGVGLEFEEVWLDASDGVRIHGWFVPGESTRTLLYFHGNAGNISHRLYTIRQFHDLGLSVFIIDYRGYGESRGASFREGPLPGRRGRLAVPHWRSWYPRGRHHRVRSFARWLPG